MKEDKQELNRILDVYEIFNDNIPWGPEPDGKSKFVRDLLTWKRGEKVWCEHIRYIHDPISDDTWDIGWTICEASGRVPIRKTWDFCPVCKAEKP